MLIEKHPRVDKINTIRRFETRDLAKRLMFIKANEIEITNYPVRPLKAFNSTHIIEKDKVIIFARLIFDYYKYVSSIARIEIELNELLSGNINRKQKLKGEISVFPDRLEDIWGAEDPRVLKMDHYYILAYTGRTKWYYREENDEGNGVKTTTVVATSKDTFKWKKIGVFSFDHRFESNLETIKNCVPLKGEKGNYVLCRLHTKSKKFYTVIASINNFLHNLEKFREIKIEKFWIGIENAKFELKNGWGTPPIKVSNKEYLVILHGVDKELYTYRAFAVLLEERENLEVTAVTPYYIMEPKHIEERYGDRPNVVFPCGLQEIDGKLIISYGAADTFIGFASVDLGELINVLEKNKIG